MMHAKLIFSIFYFLSFTTIFSPFFASVYGKNVPVALMRNYRIIFVHCSLHSGHLNKDRIFGEPISNRFLQSMQRNKAFQTFGYWEDS